MAFASNVPTNLRGARAVIQVVVNHAKQAISPVEVAPGSHVRHAQLIFQDVPNAKIKRIAKIAREA